MEKKKKKINSYLPTSTGLGYGPKPVFSLHPTPLIKIIPSLRCYIDNITSICFKTNNRLSKSHTVFIYTYISDQTMGI